MNISKFTQKSLEAVQNTEKLADRNDRVDHWHFDCGSACLVDLPQNKEENAAAGEYAGGTGASVCGKAFIGR